MGFHSDQSTEEIESSGLDTTQFKTMCHMSELAGPVAEFYQECADMAGVTLEQWLDLDLP